MSTLTGEENGASRISDKLYRMMRYRRGLIPPGKRLLPVGAPELKLAQELDVHIAKCADVEGFSEAEAWRIFDSPTFQQPRGAAAVGRHMLSEGYLTTYADGSYVLCPWQAAP